MRPAHARTGSAQAGRPCTSIIQASHENAAAGTTKVAISTGRNLVPPKPQSSQTAMVGAQDVLNMSAVSVPTQR
jgi:hypothetical protein